MHKILLPVMVAALVAIGCGTTDDGDTATSSPSTPGSPAAVQIENFSFMPSDITVPVGTTVTWTNLDDFAHTVTSGRARDTREEFPEGLLGDIGEMNARNTTFSMIVDTPGTFLYFCRYHPNMQGSITVEAG